MPNEDHLYILRQGVDAWNKWRDENLEIHPDLIRANLSEANLSEANLSGTKLNVADLNEADLNEADLSGADLNGANLTGAKLSGANLTGAVLIRADLSGAKLIEANLNGANLSGAKLIEANLIEANLSGANLSEAVLNGAYLIRAELSGANLGGAELNGANLSGAKLNGANLIRADLIRAYLSGAKLIGANLTEADLSGAVLVGTNLEYANLTGCQIYGISAWDLTVNQETKQSDLIITKPDEATVKVDDLQVAQFIYLLLNNPNVRHVIDTITSKVVLILGRFTEERKPILDALRGELRKRDYSPVLFDFDKPTSRDLTETISTLAGMSRFVIADITGAKSIAQELMAIIPSFPSVPVQPLMLASEVEYGMFEHFKRYPWVLETHRYHDLDDLLATLGEKVVTPAETKVAELRQK